MDAWEWGREDRLAGSGVDWGVVPDYREGKAEEKQGKASTEDGGLKTQDRWRRRRMGISRRNTIQSPSAGHVPGDLFF